MRKAILLVVLIAAVVAVFVFAYRRSGDGSKAIAEVRQDAPVTPKEEPGMPSSASDKTGRQKPASGPVEDGKLKSTLARYRDKKSPCMLAMESAADQDKYFFLLFFSLDDERTQAVRKDFRIAMEHIRDMAEFAEIDITDGAETILVNRYKVRRSPMPLVLAVAPNGAVTGSFQKQFDVQQLETALVSPAVEKSLKALQDRKLVMVCVQNGSTGSNESAMRGVLDLKEVPGYGPSTEIVIVDPADAEEEEFLNSLDVDPDTPEAITVCLVPPGMAVARFEGATDKDAIVAALMSAKSGCGPGGCGPSGCGK
jgi:hypothetical protein